MTVTSGNAGNFQLQNTGILGLSLGGPLTVNTGAGTLFFQGNSNTSPLRICRPQPHVVGSGDRAWLVLKDTVSGNPVLWAHRVRECEQ